MIERRNYKRYPVTLQAKIISDGKSYEGIIGNVSEEGLSYTITTFIKTESDFVPHEFIDIVVHMPSGSQLNLRCEIRWFLRASDKGQSVIIGMQIMDPPEQYKVWIRDLPGRCAAAPRKTE